MVNIRLIAVLGAAALVAVGALRVASAASPSGALTGVRLWPSHPDILVDDALGQVGAAARSGGTVPAQVRDQLALVAKHDPLAPEPYLVEGALAQTEGRDADAESLFEAARARDPRSAAARYFLADRYLRTGRLNAGLNEISVLARLVPAIDAQFVPTLAGFAKQADAVPVMRTFFERSPHYASAVLGLLAQDAANADLVVELAGPRRAGETIPPWQSAIVTKLVEDGQSAKAQAVWGRLAGAKPYHGVFNPAFRPLPAPAPFNWTYDASGGGLVTPSAEGGLAIIYYGRKEVELAEQILTLAPGSYSLSTLTGSAAPSAGLSWRLTCYPGTRSLLSADLAPVAARFAVPAQGCSAQRLQLHGSPGDAQQQVTTTIIGVRLVRTPGT